MFLNSAEVKRIAGPGLGPAIPIFLIFTTLE